MLRTALNSKKLIIIVGWIYVEKKHRFVDKVLVINRVIHKTVLKTQKTWPNCG